MPEELKLMTFNLSGAGELIAQNEPGENLAAQLAVPQGPAAGPMSTQGKPAQEQFRQETAAKGPAERETIRKLNEQVDEIASKIEREIRNLVPPSLKVQANIRFTEGSILFEGSILLFTWVGSTIFDAAKKEVEQQLSRIVKSTVERVVNRLLRLYRVTSITVDVTPEYSSLPASAPVTEFSERQQRVRLSSFGLSPVIWFLIAITLLVLVLQVALFTRFFEIRFRSDTSVPAVEKPPPKPAPTEKPNQSEKKLGTMTGSREEIQKVQEALRGRGYNPGPIDGVRRIQTERALKAFQSVVAYRSF
jgi:hypothetical protein